jgi:rhodanese-related sulfurtransferase
MFDILKNFLGKQDNSELEKAVAENPFLVDVSSSSEFSSGSVPGAVNIPLDKIPAQLSKFKGKENIIVFCRSGNRSSEAKRILERNGFERVVNGGTWQNVHQVVTAKQNI